MSTKPLLSRAMIWSMITLFWTVCVVSPAYADLVTTEQLATASELQMQRDAITEQLLRDDVKQQLLTLGVDPQSVQERISNMTAAEISQIQGQLDSLPAGAGALGTIALVLLILILLDIAGVTDIFPKI